MGPRSPWETQNGQNLLLHLLLLAAIEAFEAGVDHSLCLLAPQGEKEQEEQGQKEQGPEAEERPAGPGGGSGLLRFQPTAQTGEAVGHV